MDNSPSSSPTESQLGCPPIESRKCAGGMFPPSIGRSSSGTREANCASICSIVGRLSGSPSQQLCIKNQICSFKPHEIHAGLDGAGREGWAPCFTLNMTAVSCLTSTNGIVPVKIWRSLGCSGDRSGRKAGYVPHSRRRTRHIHRWPWNCRHLRRMSHHRARELAT